MKISVVTISYNQAGYLRECIDSVLSQSYLDVEYIVVDPGSTDGSREIIESYGDRIVKVFDKDAGPADGLNNGFAHATGDVFCYLNSDDTFRPGALKIVAEKFSQRPDVDVIYGHCHIIDANGQKLRLGYSDKFSLAAAAYGAAVVIQPSTFFRADALKGVGGFNKNNKSNWDSELFIEFALHGLSLLRVNDFLSNYRVHSEGITGSGRMELLHSEYNRRTFLKIKGRECQWFDGVLNVVHRLVKHVRNPLAALERLRFGPVFGSKG